MRTATTALSGVVPAAKAFMDELSITQVRGIGIPLAIAAGVGALYQMSFHLYTSPGEI